MLLLATCVAQSATAAAQELDTLAEVFFDTVAACGNGPSAATGPVSAEDGCSTFVHHDIPLSDGGSLQVDYSRGGHATALADYGRLEGHATAGDTAVGSPTASFAGGSGAIRVLAWATTSDTIRFARDLSGAFLLVGATLSGSTSVSVTEGYPCCAPPHVGGFARATVFDGRGNLLLGQDGANTLQSQAAQLKVPIVGSEAAFVLSLGVEADCSLVLVSGDACTADADFSSTARVTEIRVVDASGAPLNDPFTAASGHVYPSPTVSPGTAAQIQYDVIHDFGAVAPDGHSAEGLVLGDDGNLYGITPSGGDFDYGTVFKIDSTGALTTLHSFSGPDGRAPLSALCLGSDGDFYGTTLFGGSTNQGTVFKISRQGVLTTLHSFNGPDGSSPVGTLIQASDGGFYGTTSAGASGYGTVFRIDSTAALTTVHVFSQAEGHPDAGVIQGSGGSFYGLTRGAGDFSDLDTIFRLDGSGVFTTLHTFGFVDGVGPSGGLLQATDGQFYGTTFGGGALDAGTIFRISADGSFATVHTFSGSDGASPVAALIQGADGSLYGTTQLGGDFDRGTVFRLDSTGALTTLHSFSGSDGAIPDAALVEMPDGSLWGGTQSGGVSGIGAIFRLDNVGVFRMMYSFSLSGVGTHPRAGVTEGSDGAFYGSTSLGGTANLGTLFKVDPATIFSTLHSFSGADGRGPFSSLTARPDGSLYGATPQGGASDSGTIFTTDRDGTITILHMFDGNDGVLPYGQLTLASDGNVYGTTSAGGAAAGTVFRMDPAGGVTTLHEFSRGADGGYPDAGVIQAADGLLYGTTAGGGLGFGTLFRMTLDGALTTLHTFTGGADGRYPHAHLVQAADGSFYGTTSGDFTSNFGTVFKVDSGGTLVTLHTFSGTNDGGSPAGAMVETADGALYGTTNTGGAFGFGTVFRIDAAGEFTTVHDFTGTDGAHPQGDLIQGDDGSLYGTAADGGAHNTGVIFRIRLDHPPVAHDDAYAADEGGILHVPASGVLGNDSDPDNDPLTAVLIDGPAHGMLTLQTDGSFTYTPAASYIGSDTFTYYANDGSADSNAATVSIAVGATNPPPLAVVVDAPNGGEKLFQDVPTTIAWSTTGTPTSIDVELSRHGSAGPFVAVDGCTGLPGTAASCSWTPAGPASADALVRVTAHDASGASASDISDAVFAISVATPRISLMAPRGGSWAIGTEQTIAWRDNLGPHVPLDLDISRDGGTTWEPIAEGVEDSSAHAGSYVWRVTGPLSATAMLRIRALDTAASDVTPPFTIVAPALTIRAPNVGVHWKIGDTRTIAWSHNLGTGEAVTLELSRDGGATWTTVATNVPDSHVASGTFSWVVTGPVTSAARIRVSWARDPSVRDESDVNFTIASRIRVTNLAGLPWGAGSVRTVSWTHDYGVSQRFDVAFTPDGGATWTAIATGVAAADPTSGAYTGVIPLTPTLNGFVRVSPAGEPGNGDTNNVPLTVAEPSLMLLAPNRPVSWAIGSVHRIAWRHNLGSAEAVSIDWSADDGATWQTVAAIVPAATNSSGRFDWTVPGPATPSARIRVRWLRSPSVQDTSDVTFRIQ